MINLRLLARPTVAWELTANFARTSTYFAMLFVLAQYLQQGLGRSATYSGLVLVSWVAAFGVAAPVTRRLSAWAAPFGGVLGSLILAAAFAAVSAASAPGAFLVVALGATAARSLLGRAVPVTAERGKWITRADGREVLVTLHPSALLRLDSEVRGAAFDAFVADIRQARRVFR